MQVCMEITYESQGSFGILTSFALAASCPDQPSCRWLEQNNSRIFQCSVQTLETADLPDDAMTDGLPDPTLPLAKRSSSKNQYNQVARRAQPGG